MADYTCSAKCKNGGAEYTAGDGIVIEDNTISVVGKQDTLTAGDNISISEENVISAIDTVYTAGNGISISNENEISINIPSDYILKSSTDWTDLLDSNNKLVYDLCFVVYGSLGDTKSAMITYLPKGMTMNPSQDIGYRLSFKCGESYNTSTATRYDYYFDYYSLNRDANGVRINVITTTFDNGALSITKTTETYTKSAYLTPQINTVTLYYKS